MKRVLAFAIPVLLLSSGAALAVDAIGLDRAADMFAEYAPDEPELSIDELIGEGVLTFDPNPALLQQAAPDIYDAAEAQSDDFGDDFGGAADPEADADMTPATDAGMVAVAADPVSDMPGPLPEPEIATGWQSFARFGLSFAVPPEFSVFRDEDDAFMALDKAELKPPACAVQVTLDNAVDIGDAPEEEGFVRLPDRAAGFGIMLSGFSMTGEDGDIHMNGVMLYTDKPMVEDDHIMFGISCGDVPDAQSEALIAGILPTLRLTQAPETPPPPLGGLVTATLPQDWSVYSDSDTEWIVIAPGMQAAVNFRLGDKARSAVADLAPDVRFRHLGDATIAHTQMFGTDGWLFTGIIPPDDPENGIYSGGMQGSNSYFFTDRCAPDGDPLVVSFSAQQSWIDKGNSFQTFLNSVELHWPEGETDCGSRTRDAMFVATGRENPEKTALGGLVTIVPPEGWSVFRDRHAEWTLSAGDRQADITFAGNFGTLDALERLYPDNRGKLFAAEPAISRATLLGEDGWLLSGPIGPNDPEHDIDTGDMQGPLDVFITDRCDGDGNVLLVLMRARQSWLDQGNDFAPVLDAVSLNWPERESVCSERILGRIATATRPGAPGDMPAQQPAQTETKAAVAAPVRSPADSVAETPPAAAELPDASANAPADTGGTGAWTDYVNAEFGTAISYPADLFVTQSDAADGNGIQLATADGGAELKAGGTHLDQAVSADDMMREMLMNPQIDQLTGMKRLSDTSFRIDGMQGGQRLIQIIALNDTLMSLFGARYSDSYADVVAEVADTFHVVMRQPEPPQPPVGDSGESAVELAFWETIKDSTDPADFEAYLAQFPDGVFAALARIRIGRLGAGQVSAPATMPGHATQPETLVNGPNGVYAATDWGNITFATAEDGSVRATYPFSNGRITGTMQGLRLVGRWKQDSSSHKCFDGQYWGQVQFDFAPDMSGFTGLWSYCEADPAKNSTGILTTAAPATMPGSMPPTDTRNQGPNGVYSAAAWGNISFATASDGSVNATYPFSNGRISGTMQGLRLVGRWKQDSSSHKCFDGRYWGRVQFDFAPDMSGFTGLWSYCEADPAKNATGILTSDAPVPAAPPPAPVVSSDSHDWQTYFNDRYGVQINYPADLFRALPPPTNNDGRQFEQVNGNGGFYIFSQYNALEEPIEVLFQQDRSRDGEQVSDADLAGNAFQVSGTRDAFVFFRRTLLAPDGLISVFELRIDRNDIALFNDIATPMDLSFAQSNLESVSIGSGGGPNGVFGSPWGDIAFATDGNGNVYADYEGGQSHMTGQMQGDVMIGRWLEPASGRQCADGTHWGRLRLDFSGDFQSFQGLWGYCEDEPAKTFKGTWSGPAGPVSGMPRPIADPVHSHEPVNATPSSTGGLPPASTSLDAYLTPQRGDPTRQALMDAARPVIAGDIGQNVLFVVDVLRTDGQWAYLQATPTQPTGLPLDWSTTRYAADWQADAMSDTVMVLFVKQNGTWQVVDYVVGPTDVYWYSWIEQYGLPEVLFYED